MNTPTIDQMKRGIAIAEEIEALQAEMAALFGGVPHKPVAVHHAAPAPGRGGRRKLSPQALANIRAAQKKRWAKVNAGKASPKAAAEPRKKRKMSPAHRAKLKAGAKKRWAAIRAGKAPNPFAKKG